MNPAILVAAAGALAIGASVAKRAPKIPTSADKAPRNPSIFFSPAALKAASKAIAENQKSAIQSSILSVGAEAIKAFNPLLTPSEKVDLPLPTIAGIVYQARLNVPLDGEDNAGARALESAAESRIGGKVVSYRHAQQWLMERLFEAMMFGLEPDGRRPIPLADFIDFWIAYEMSPSSPAGYSDTARALRLYALADQIATHPTCATERVIKWMGATLAYQRAKRGRYPETQILYATGQCGVAHKLWKDRLTSGVKAWKAAHGGVSIEGAPTAAQRELIVMLGTFLEEMAYRKVTQWRIGHPSKPKVDWGQFILSFISVGLSGVTGDYEQMINTAVQYGESQKGAGLKETADFAISEFSGSLSL